MNFLSITEAKREGQSLTGAQIQEIISRYTAGSIPDYQMAAFLMAVYFCGLNPLETRALTLAMRDSGEVLRWPDDPRPLVDKHSTGGVGDKVSLPLTPLLACLGFRVPMIAGRGLGITGGTLDKLESIPGFKTWLSSRRILENVQKVGCVICGQNEQMVPADKELYALRDVTGTVPSVPLIVASIMSKKLAENLDALVLDVKCGSAAFVSNVAKARELARVMVALGKDCGVNTRALLTNMDAPLGRTAGNWLEVKEAVACLSAGARTPRPQARPSERHADEASALRGWDSFVRSEGGARNGAGEAPGLPSDDLRELVLTCAAHLLVQTGRARTFPGARQQAERCLASGEPRRKWDEMLAAQGADLRAFHRKLALDHAAPVVLELKAPCAGYITRCDARLLGEIIRDLGGGRLAKDSSINHDVGVDRLSKPGEKVARGALMARVHAANRTQAKEACARLRSAFSLSSRRPSLQALILETIS